MIYEPFGWQGEKIKPRNRMPLPKAPPTSLGEMDPGRIRDFMQGVKESRDQRTKALLEMAGVYVAVQAWSAWRHHQREAPR